jgi:membrane-anchored protein YejM (alkaline phosphatase superfamily)
MSVSSSTAYAPRRTLLRWLGWFALLNAGLLLLVGLRFLHMAGRPDTAMAKLFLPLAWLGHFTTLALVGVLPAALLALLWPRRALVVPVAAAVSGFILVTTALDAVVFNLYRFHLNGMVWSLIVNGGLTEILPLTTGTWAIVAGAGLLLLALEVGCAFAVRAWIRVPQRHGRPVAAALVLVVLAGHVLHAWADATHHTAITRPARVFPAYHALTAAKTMKKLGFSVAPSDPMVRVKGEGTALNYPLRPLTNAAPAAPLNVLVLVIDAWRYDMLTERATPNLHRFGARCLRFDRHTSAANSTRFGVFSLFYGLCGSYWHAMLAEQRGPVLIRQMLQAGYQFGIYGSARLTSPEFDRTVFEEIRDRIPLHTPAATVPDRDQEINRRFLGFLDQRDPARPFLGFLFYDGSHAYAYPEGAPEPFQPVSPPIKHLQLGPDTDPTPIRNRFLNAVHAVDVLAGEALDRLERDGLLTNTVVIITGDHGQEFNDTGRGLWGHNSSFSRVQTDVPFLLHWPGRAPGVVDYPTSHLDVAPTLLREALGCAAPLEDYCNGKLLFDPAPRLPLIAATWDAIALLSPGRIDVLSNRGDNEYLDENYQPIPTRTPPALIGTATREMSRFYAR